MHGNRSGPTHGRLLRALGTGGPRDRAGQGIGAGIARRLARAGARVAVFDADVDRAAHVADELGGLAIVGDVRSEADAPRRSSGSGPTSAR